MMAGTGEPKKNRRNPIRWLRERLRKHSRELDMMVPFSVHCPKPGSLDSLLDLLLLGLKKSAWLLHLIGDKASPGGSEVARA